MGCDIHLFAEFFDDEEREWRFLPAPHTEKPWRYTYEGHKETDTPGFYVDSSGMRYPRQWFDNRNYQLFGMLADVRSTPPRHVLGKSVDAGGYPVDHTRGWPTVCSPEIGGMRDQIEHTPSWLTVAELRGFFALLREDGIRIKTSGTIPALDYTELRDLGTPPSFRYLGINGDTLRLSPEVFDLLDSTKMSCRPVSASRMMATYMLVDDLPIGVGGPNLAELHEVELVVEGEFDVPATAFTSNFESMLDELMEASPADPADTRVVFYFDG